MNMKKATNLRSLAAQLIERVVDKGESLSAILPGAQKTLADKDGALLQELCFGVMRTLPQLEALIGKLMERPLTGKQRVLHYLIMVGLYQVLYTRVPAHAALAETVAGAEVLKRAKETKSAGPRLPATYGNFNETPLRAEVQPGRQVIDFDIKGIGVEDHGKAIQ